MAEVSTYLNFRNESEAAFRFYASVFGTEMEGLMRHGDVPGAQVDDETRDLVMNVALRILGGHLLMASDIPPSMGRELTPGNNVQITLHPDTRGEADQLFAGLSEGGTPVTPMQEMFWGDYYGELTDRFGIHWLINCSSRT
ncbi:MAG TPA: VOC family protein [Longimicrobiales bacterium]|nr:VOC family protein [Longimicrobiales bacterium]